MSKSAGKMTDSDDKLKRKQFGNRFLKNENDVFKHNAWQKTSFIPTT